MKALFKFLLVFAIFLLTLNANEKGKIDMHGGKTQSYGGFAKQIDSNFSLDKFMDKNTTKSQIKAK